MCGLPISFIDELKLRKIEEASYLYMAKNNIVNESYRYDGISILYSKMNRNFIINHYKALQI